MPHGITKTKQDKNKQTRHNTVLPYNRLIDQWLIEIGKRAKMIKYGQKSFHKLHWHN